MAKRNISALELAILQGALATGETVETLATKAGVDAADLQAAFKPAGVTLPTASAARLTEDEQTAYMAALAGGISAAELPGTYGFTAGAMLDRLRESQLLIPLNEDEMNAYSIAVEEGLTEEQAAERFGVGLDVVTTALGAAGLSLTGKKPAKAATPQIGSANPMGAWAQMPSYKTTGGIPQIPSIRLLMNRMNKQADPNWMGTTDTILTSGRGVTSDPNVSVRTILGS